MIGLLLPVAMNAQVTVESNFITTTEYVGCDASSTQPLRFTTLANYPHEWRTNNLLRMRLNHSTTYAVGSFTTPAAAGYLGLSPDGSLWNPLYANGPFSRLHIHDGKTIVQAHVIFITHGSEAEILHTALSYIFNKKYQMLISILYSSREYHGGISKCLS